MPRLRPAVARLAAARPAAPAFAAELSPAFGSTPHGGVPRG